MKNNDTQNLVLVAFFSALILFLALTPFIGYIPIGPIKATTIHLPVIIGAIMLGPKKGAFLGFIFGLTSFINNSFISPTITSFLFTPFYPGGNFKSLIICFIPRILIGVAAYYVYAYVKKLTKGKSNISMISAGIVGSLTNTILVMSMIYLFFGREYAAARQVGYEVLIGVILSTVCMNGIPEAIVAAIITVAVCNALFTFLKRSNKL